MKLNDKCIILVIWIIAGIFVLIDKAPTKLQYGLCWGCLLVELTADIIRKGKK